MAALGRVPRVGDEVPLPGWTLQVARMDGRRVDRVRFIAGPATDPEPASPDGDDATGERS